MRILLIAMMIVFWGGEASARNIYVAVSIRPIHSLVEMVLGDVGSAELMMTGAASPHGGTMRPSERQALAEADLVFLIDPDFETVYAKNLPPPERRVLLSKAEGIVLLKRRVDGHDPHHEHHHEEEGLIDLHLWLDPDNAVAMIGLIRDRLGIRYPEHRDAFRANAEAAIDSLHELDDELANLLTPVAGRGFITHHDAYAYLEAAYGLNYSTSIFDHHDAGANIQRIQELRQIVRTGEAVCLFHEPQFDNDVLGVIDPQSKLKQAELDPLSADLEAGAEFYVAMMRRLAFTMADCLH